MCNPLPPLCPTVGCAPPETVEPRCLTLADCEACGDARTQANADIRDLQLLNNGADGWAVGDADTILHTTDGGSSWTQRGCPSDVGAVRFESRFRAFLSFLPVAAGRCCPVCTRSAARARLPARGLLLCMAYGPNSEGQPWGARARFRPAN